MLTEVSEMSQNYQYKIYSVKNYATANEKFIKNNEILFTRKTKLCNELELDNSYHFRVHKKTQYIFFGDLDGYIKGIKNFIKLLIDFLKTTYNLELCEDEVYYTKNTLKLGSYHYSIPKWNLSCENLKELHKKFLNENKEEFLITNEKKITSCIDTTIYSEHWYRAPNQSKGSIEDTGKHIIKKGIMKNFIIDYIHIPKYSININDIIEKENNIEVTNNKEKIIKKENNIEIINNKKIIKKNNEIDVINNKTEIIPYENKELIFSRVLSDPELFIKLFDGCYKQERFNLYEYWLRVGMAIQSYYGENETGVKLFDYFSSKGNNYEGYEKTKLKYLTFIKKHTKEGITVATIYYYAKEDNKPKFIEIINKNSFELGQTDICKYIKVLAGNRFIYKIQNDIYKLYCYNGKYWTTNDVLLKKYIVDELYNFLRFILVEVYWNSKEFNILKKSIERLKDISTKRDLIETYKEEGLNEEILFDDKWWLLGFNNLVYDMKEHQFREYHYDDYVATTTGYDWRDSTEEELNTVNNLINLIFPIEDERELYLQILATGLDGRCLEKFIIANGCGSNGKSLLDDLCLKALGNYGMIGNNSILFEQSRTGSNPEKANLHKKRLTIFCEPCSKNKFENSIIKELTGGGTFSARGHHEKQTEKELNLTIIVECNAKPLLKDEITNAEIRRIIDIYFRSTFTTDKTQIDHSNNIYMANLDFKTSEWQNQHKFALIKILTRYHKEYLKNNSILKIPKFIADRTQNYLELSCDILSWFKDTFELTGNKDDTIKVKDIYALFIRSTHYENMTKAERKKYNKSYFVKFIETDKFFIPYYCAVTRLLRTFIKCWKIKIDNDEPFLDE
jgi:phage/plasmid-associated DNA primase